MTTEAAARPTATQIEAGRTATSVKTSTTVAAPSLHRSRRRRVCTPGARKSPSGTSNVVLVPGASTLVIRPKRTVAPSSPLTTRSRCSDETTRHRGWGTPGPRVTVAIASVATGQIPAAGVVDSDGANGAEDSRSEACSPTGAAAPPPVCGASGVHATTTPTTPSIAKTMEPAKRTDFGPRTHLIKSVIPTSASGFTAGTLQFRDILRVFRCSSAGSHAPVMVGKQVRHVLVLGCVTR